MAWGRHFWTINFFRKHTIPYPKVMNYLMTTNYRSKIPVSCLLRFKHLIALGQHYQPMIPPTEGREVTENNDPPCIVFVNKFAYLHVKRRQNCIQLPFQEITRYTTYTYPRVPLTNKCPNSLNFPVK